MFKTYKLKNLQKEYIRFNPIILKIIQKYHIYIYINKKNIISGANVL